jgi:HAD superfamily hydrolase (TIGR01459 family)
VAQGVTLSAAPSPLHTYPGVAALAVDYDGFILDLWGVIHDGVAVFPGVIDALTRMDAAGKRFLMLSNAPRRADVIAEGMAKMGIPENFCRAIVSSGEAAWQELKTRRDPWYARLGRTCLHFGPDRDLNMFGGLDLERVPKIEEASFIMNTGPWRDEEQVSDYEDLMQSGVARKLPMVCVNPDLEVYRGGKRIICAGALAQRYEELGGDVRYEGKPYKEIYGRCFETLGVDKRRVLAIGDSLRTDIAGAHAAGIDSVLVTATGLHKEDSGPEAIAAACERAGVRPTGLMTRLSW